MRTGMDAEIDMTLYLGLSARIWMTLLESNVSWSLDKCIYTSHSGFFLGFVNDRLYLWQMTSARNGSKRYAWPPFCMTLMTALQQQMSSLHALSIEVPRIEVTVWRCHAVYSISQSHFALRKAIPEKADDKAQLCWTQDQNRTSIRDQIADWTRLERCAFDLHTW